MSAMYLECCLMHKTLQKTRDESATVKDVHLACLHWGKNQWKSSTVEQKKANGVKGPLQVTVKKTTRKDS